MKKSMMFLAFLAISFIFYSCESKSAQRAERIEQLNETEEADSLSVSEVSEEEIMARCLNGGTAGMVGLSVAGKIFFIEKGSFGNFIMWINNDGGLFLSFNFTPSLKEIKNLKSAFVKVDDVLWEDNPFFNYMDLNNEGVIKSTFLIGSVEGDQLEEVYEAMEKLRKISSLKEEKVWKDFSYKEKGKATIIFSD